MKSKHIIIPSEVSKNFINLPISIDSNSREKKLWGYFWKRYPLTFDFCLNAIDFVKKNKIPIRETFTLYEFVILEDFLEDYLSFFPYQIRYNAKQILQKTVIKENFDFSNSNIKIENLLAVWIEKWNIPMEYLVIRISKLLFKPLIEDIYFKGGNKYIKIPSFFYPITSFLNEDRAVIKTNSIYKLNVFALTESVENETGNTIEVCEDVFWRSNILEKNISRYEAIKDLTNKSQRLFSFLQENGISTKLATTVFWNKPEKKVIIFLKETF